MKRTSRTLIVGLIGLAALTILFTAGCDYSEEGKTKEAEVQTTPILPFLASGSTFIAPLINRWGNDYEKSHMVHVNYHPIGSAGGIKNLKQGVGVFLCE